MWAMSLNLLLPRVKSKAVLCYLVPEWYWPSDFSLSLFPQSTWKWPHKWSLPWVQVGTGHLAQSWKESARLWCSLPLRIPSSKWADSSSPGLNRSKAAWTSSRPQIFLRRLGPVTSPGTLWERPLWMLSGFHFSRYIQGSQLHQQH